MKLLPRLACPFVVLLIAVAAGAGGTKLFPTCEPSADCRLAALRAMVEAAELLADRKLAEAARQAAAAAQLMPASASPHVLSGLALEQQERRDEAVAEYREALAWDPDESRALAALERLHAAAYTDTVTPFEVQLFHLINEARQAEGVKALKAHAILAKVAREHSDTMRDLGFFAHESSKPGYKTGQDRFLRRFDCPPQWIGENIARRWMRPERALQEANIAEAHCDLLASSGHRRNILHPDFAYVGIGIATNDHGDYWITEMFMTPPDSPPLSRRAYDHDDG